MPCSCSAIEISLDSMPQIDDGDGVRGDALQAVGEELAILPLADFDAATAAADDDAGARLTEAQAGVDARPHARR